MPQLKAAKKALSQNIKRKSDNLARTRKFKKILRKIRDLVKAQKVSEAKKLIPEAYKYLDKAAKKNTIHRNTASRYKSRITKLINTSKVSKTVKKKK